MRSEASITAAGSTPISPRRATPNYRRGRSNSSARLPRNSRRRAELQGSAATATSRLYRSRVQPATRPAEGSVRRIFVEQFGELLDHDAAELLGVDDRHGAPVIARHVMADSDRDQFDRRALLDVLDDPAQMPLQIVAGIYREG